MPRDESATTGPPAPTLIGPAARTSFATIAAAVLILIASYLLGKMSIHYSPPLGSLTVIVACAAAAVALFLFGVRSKAARIIAGVFLTSVIAGGAVTAYPLGVVIAWSGRFMRSQTAMGLIARSLRSSLDETGELPPSTLSSLIADREFKRFGFDPSSWAVTIVPGDSLERIGPLTVWREPRAWQPGVIVAWIEPQETRVDPPAVAFGDGSAIVLHDSMAIDFAASRERAEEAGVIYPRELTDFLRRSGVEESDL